MLSSDAGGDTSEPRSRKQPQSDAGGRRERTTAKEEVRGRNQHGYEGLEKSVPSSRKTQKNRKSIANSRREEHRRSGGSLERFDTVKEPVANSKIKTEDWGEKRNRHPNLSR